MSWQGDAGPGRLAAGAVAVVCVRSDSRKGLVRSVIAMCKEKQIFINKRAYRMLSPTNSYDRELRKVLE